MLNKVTLVVTLCTFMAGCKEESSSKKVAIVDGRTGGDPTTGTQAVSDEDFAALQAEVKELKEQLAALNTVKTDVANLKQTSATKTDVANNTASINTLSSAVANQGSQLALVNSAVNSLATSSLKQLWLYDGTGSRRHKVRSIQDFAGYQQAIVEVSSGINARYKVNVRASAVANQGPMPLENSLGDPMGISFSLSNCTGEGVVADGTSGGDYGQAGSVGGYIAWIEPNATTYAAFSQSSLYSNNGACGNSAVAAGKVAVVTLHPLSSYTYPNPLTVGP